MVVEGLRKVYREGGDIGFTSSKDGHTVYTISLKWPGNQLALRSARAVKGSPVSMLGVHQPLKWQQNGVLLVVDIPPEVAEHKPCRPAFAFKLLVETA